MATPLAEVKSAKKHALSMGRYSGWLPEYNNHPLAACMDNYTWMLDAELASDEPDYLSGLLCILAMARRINAYCDECKVVGDSAAQHWLERFVWRCDSVCQFDCLTSN